MQAMVLGSTDLQAERSQSPKTTVKSPQSKKEVVSHVVDIEIQGKVSSGSAQKQMPLVNTQEYAEARLPQHSEM